MVVDARWIRVTLFCPGVPPMLPRVFSEHTTRILGEEPHKDLFWNVRSHDAHWSLEVETRHEEDFSAYILHARTHGSDVIQGPQWLKRLTMALFEPTGASLGFATAVEPGLEYRLGLHLGVLMAPWSIAVFVNRDYGEMIEAMRKVNGQTPTWMAEPFGDGNHGLFWPGWFGAPETPRPWSWPWDVDIDLPYVHRVDQISAVGFGPSLDAEILADVLQRWLDVNPLLTLDSNPGGLPFKVWLLLVVANSLYSKDLGGPECLVEERRLRFSLDELSTTRRLSLLAALTGRSNCGHVCFMYDNHPITLVFNEEQRDVGDPVLELHFTLNHEDDAQEQGWPWQLNVLRSLAQLAPLDWWSGDIYGNASSLKADDVHNPDIINSHPFVIQRTSTGLDMRVDEGWFKP